MSYPTLEDINYIKNTFQSILGFSEPMPSLLETQLCPQVLSSNNFFYFPDWAQISLLAMLTSVFVLTFFYLIANFFQNQRLIPFIKIELFEIFVSFFIFVVFFIFLTTFCSLKASIFYITDPDFINKSIYYATTNSLINFANLAILWLHIEHIIYTYLEISTYTEINATPMGIGLVMKPTFGIGSTLLMLIKQAAIAQTISIVTLLALANVFEFLSFAFLKYLIPLGLVMRAFSPTRRVGGAIIALTASFIFIYPLLVIPIYSSLNISTLKMLHYSISKMTEALGINLYDILFGGALFGFLVTISPQIALVVFTPALAGLITIFLAAITAKIFLGAIFFPILITVIMVAATNHLSRMLGEQVDITTLTRMI